MITLEKEIITDQPAIKVIKRDGRSVNFEAEKIYNALLKASNNVTKLSPLVEAKLETISNNIIAEIIDRFKDDVKIYENQFRENGCAVFATKPFDADFKNGFLNFTFKPVSTKTKTK